ncbi:MAG TPA: hypothetical protein VFH48_09185 [Chloroflexota bacterium]|nr:hypothetical protein [Chloroflexota bacterium]
MFTKRAEHDDVRTDVATTRTEIRDIAALGPELDESQLAAVVGGFIRSASPTDPKCGGCH